MAENPTAAAGPLGTGRSGMILAEYRQPSRYRWPSLRRLILAGLCTGLLTWTWVGSKFPFLLLLDCFVAPVALYNGVMFIWRDRFRTRLTTEGIEIRGYFNHFVPWQEVSAIRDDGYGRSQPIDKGYEVRVGTRRRGSQPTTGPRARLGVIRIFRTSGKSKILRAPLVTSWAADPYFETKLKQMQELSGQYGTRPVH